VRVGVLVTGDIAVRAAHSLSAHPGIDEVVVVGPARSRSFRVATDGAGCDLLVGTGTGAPAKALELGVGLVWDGHQSAPGVSVWGASPLGLTLALASREPDPRLVALAHPDLEEGTGEQVRFPDPIGRLPVTDIAVDGRHVAAAKSPNQFTASLVDGGQRRVAIVDDCAFLSGVALAAAVLIADEEPAPAWDRALDYLKTATAMGLVMADDR
jgi:hypothetical protein